MVLRFLIFLANLAGDAVVGIVVVRGILTYLSGLARLRDGAGPEEDILGTALDPTQQDLSILAAVVALRTLLNFFLGRELDAAQRRRHSETNAPGDAGQDPPGRVLSRYGLTARNLPTPDQFWPSSARLQAGSGRVCADHSPLSDHHRRQKGLT